MDNCSHEHGNDVKKVWGVLAGLLVGGLAGAGVMLLLAPQSGKKTRAQIQQKSTQLRDQTVKTVGSAVTHARNKAHQFTAGVHKQAEALQQRGQEMLDEQKDHLSKTLKGWGKAVQA